MVSLSLRCVEWRWCVLLLCCPVCWCGSCPTHPIAVLASTAVMSCTVPCQVLRCVGGGCVSVVFVWWGILCPLPPRRGGGWGRCGWWGAVVVVGGTTREGRQCYRLPVECRCPSSVCWRPPCCLPCGPIEWRGLCCDALSSDWVWHLALSCSLSYCSVPLLLLCVAVFVVGCGMAVV